MPLPTDEKLLALSKDILEQFDKIFGLHPGFRPAHAKGILLQGTFQPSLAAASLTRAPHMNQESTPVWVRFSDATGLPLIPDNNPNANPKGCAIRFQLGERAHTDIIAHSANGFPARNGQEFLEFLRALAATDPTKPAGSPLEAFLGTHPRTLAFVHYLSQLRPALRGNSSSASRRCVSPTRLARAVLAAIGWSRKRASII
jgi:catalase